MLEEHTLPDSIITECLKTHYGILVASLKFLPIGADINARIYKAETLDQRSYFIKVKLGYHHDLGLEIVKLLKQRGIDQIIPPIPTIHGKSSQPIDDYTLIVYPFIKGEDGFSRSLTDGQWIELGKALRLVHEVDVPLSLQKRIRQETFSPKWQDAMRAIYPHVESSLTTDEIGLKLQKFMKKAMPDIHRLVDRAEELGKTLQSHPPKFVLCHSDIHGGNVLIHDNSNIYIVDWDEPIMAPKERDLMFIGGGVGNVWNHPTEEVHFYQGYGKTEIHPIALAYYRHERIVEDMAIYSQELLLKRTGGQSRIEMYRHFIAMFEPQGVVDIAFKRS